MDITIYSKGLCFTSVCAHKDATISEITAFINEENPTGLDHGWELSDKDFADGSQNPGDCGHDSDRTHFLFSC